MKEYLRTFLRFDAPSIRRAVLLNCVAALTEGAGLLLLLPLLSLAGVMEHGGGKIEWLAPIDATLAVLGVNWTLEGALFMFVALILVQSQLAMRRDRVSNALQLRFGDHLRKKLYGAIARANWRFLMEHHSGELLSVLTSEVQRIGMGTYFLLRFFTHAVMLLAYLTVALHLSGGLTLLALATGVLLWALLHRADDAAKRGGKMLNQANRDLFNQIQEFISVMKLIKIHGEEAGNAQRFNHRVEQVSEQFLEFQQIRTRVQAVYRVGGAVALAVVSYAALTWFKLPAADLLVMIAIFARMLPQLAELQNGRQQLLHMLPAYDVWQKLLDACEANVDPVQSVSHSVQLIEGLHLARVAFRYAHHPIRIENLSIPARKTTAIVGASGAGKTTLLDLLSGLLMPEQGEILINGTPLPQLSGWRHSIAYIPQETQIQNGTIRENLSWGNTVAQEADIARALSQAALATWVQRLPLGLDTQVGEKGVKLSGGEKQRLALARALLRRPQLLILDEATSALDPDNHRLVLDAIRTLHGQMTVLIVTHRIDELTGLIDGVVRVEKGEVGQWQAVK
ncbi:MAG: ABC transporter ATP-binding protein [Gallionella sp.]|nr:ABC transporter ATP-binding protein [Gallionella sp.]MDD4958635.1 ABC transporter ATP-binding protein [Gallionella sp.]